MLIQKHLERGSYELGDSDPLIDDDAALVSLLTWLMLENNEIVLIALYILAGWIYRSISKNKIVFKLRCHTQSCNFLDFRFKRLNGRIDFFQLHAN